MLELRELHCFYNEAHIIHGVAQCRAGRSRGAARPQRHGKNHIDPVGHGSQPGLGSRGASVVCCHQGNHDERDITCDKSVPHCEDQRIGSRDLLRQMLRIARAPPTSRASVSGSGVSWSGISWSGRRPARPTLARPSRASTCAAQQTKRQWPSWTPNHDALRLAR